MTAVIVDEEVIQWIAVDDRLPDDDTTVLVSLVDADEPVWLGYYEAGDWFSIDNEEYGIDLHAAVTAWAPMPRGALAHQSDSEAT